MSTESAPDPTPPNPKSLTNKIILFCLENKLVVFLAVAFVLAWGLIVAPFDWDLPLLPRQPVAVDAIPDIGENQQIVFTEWMGRSPQDVDDQITYPLTVALLGIPHVKTIRSYSMFGFSTIFIIFEEDAEFYWTRSRILERLNSLPAGTLPDGVQPGLGPDATGLGQVYWYTLEGRDPDGNPAGGWDPHELRSIQDWYVRFRLNSAEGISEVASIGGFQKEYQIDVDPDAMRAYNVTLEDVYDAVRNSNVEVGARTIEVNRVEYLVRGRGFLKTVEDIEKSVVKVEQGVPVYIRNVGKVTLGPALRTGALDKGGAEAVGGVVVVRYGANPLDAIKNVKREIEDLAPGLPVKPVIDYTLADRAQVEAFAQENGFTAYAGSDLNDEAWMGWLRSNGREAWPEWITTSQVTIVPFYDRTGLIYETLGTLSSALYQQVLITTIVVVVMVMHLRSSFLIALALPLSVLATFIIMKLANVSANVVALSGIAIAIGTLVDMGIIMCENILKRLDEAHPDENRLWVVYRGASEVGSAIITAVSTTIVGFLPVFAMTGPEGKLFIPLAFTKTSALTASVVIAIFVVPALAHLLLVDRPIARSRRPLLAILLGIAGIASLAWLAVWLGFMLIALAIYHAVADHIPHHLRRFAPWIANAIVVAMMAYWLTADWMPLGIGRGFSHNLIFVVGITGGLLLFFDLFRRYYGPILRWCLDHKLAYMCVPGSIMIIGITAWLGFDRTFAFLPATAESVGIDASSVRQTRFWSEGVHTFPGFGKEFMPPLDEGSFLFMPTTMPHASIGEAQAVLEYQDKAIASIPEIDSVVGKLGRVESALDPAPTNMFETVVNYKPEYKSDENGRVLAFRFDESRNKFARDEAGELIPDPDGRPFRQWRDHIHSPDDIWNEIVAAAELPGTTSAPKLQPIATRLIMLQSGMRAPMGVKVKGPDLETIEKVGFDIERLLKQVPSVEAPTVVADRIVGKPYLEIDIDRDAIARYGLSIQDVQDTIEVALGGVRITTTVEGRERYAVRVRYMRELRDSIETMGRILVPSMEGAQIPLEQLADIRYVRGPEAIKSEDTFLVSYVLFDKKAGKAEVDVVEDCQRYLEAKLASGEFVLPPGVTYAFAGNYENQIHSQKTLAVVLPLSLFTIFVILYFQFRAITTTSLVFVGILAAWSGGFLLLWFYAQPWFMNFSVWGMNVRDVFQISPINLSVAIWVGFLALFGIAEDDGVVIATYLDDSFNERKPDTVAAIREATLQAGLRRIRPCLMTSSTTILALLPVLTSTGRGSDIMLPMAIPSVGGMTIVLLTLFMVPVLYCWKEEIKLRRKAAT